MSVYSQTRQELRHDIARVCDPNFQTGVAGVCGAGTVVVNLTGWQFGDDHYNDALEVFDYSGTGIGKSAKPTDWVNTTHVLTFVPAETFTAADLIELHWLATVTEYNAAINRAILEIQREALVYTTDESIVLDSLLTNGMFDSAYTVGWTLVAGGGGTATADTTYKVSGAQSCKVTSAAANTAVLSQAIANYPKYREKTVNLKAKVWCATASRVRICLTDGVTTTYSDYHDGGGWDELTIDSFTVDDTPTSLTVSLRTETGGILVCYWDSVTLTGDHIYEYDLATSFLYINKVELESGTGIDQRDIYDHYIPFEYWKPLRESTKRIQFKNWTPIAGRRIRIHGLAVQAELTADTTTCAIFPEYIIHQACSYVHAARMFGGAYAEAHAKAYEYHKKEAMIAKLQAVYSLPLGSKRVER